MVQGRLIGERLGYPVTETVDLSDDAALVQLVGKARVCISVVSYWQVGEKVVKACIESGTEYVDA